MAKEKKEPKTNKEGLLSKDAETILIGLMIVLVALIGLLNKGPVGEFLTFCAAYLFGVFYFVVYLILLFIGIYLILKRKLFKVKIDITLLGVILLLLGVSIISVRQDQNITLNNVFDTFNKTIGRENVIQAQNLGGGLIGYFLYALLNTAIQQTGTLIVCFVLMAVGLALALYRPISSLSKFFKKIKEKRKERKEKEEADKIVVEEVIDEEEKEGNLEYTSVDETRQASRATFVFSSDIGTTKTTTTPVLAEDIEEEDEIKIESTKEETFEEIDAVIETTVPLREEVVVAPRASKVTYTPSVTVTPTTSTTTTTTKVTKPSSTPTSEYVYPSLELLNDVETADVEEENERVALERQKLINDILEDFGVGATVTGYTIGPSVTRYDLITNRDVSINTLLKYIDDIAVRLGGITNTRFEKVVKGKSTSGLELPNAQPIMVSFKECITQYIGNPKHKYRVPFGKDITGDVIGVKVTDYPHMLVGGTTGSGKSIFIHNIIMSLIMTTTPEELRLLLIDPKQVEMGKYKEIPHLLCPMVSDYAESKVAMERLVGEMERRYAMLVDAGVSDLAQYNEYALENNLPTLPIIVCIIDEYANLVDNCKDIASPVVKIAAKSRACGIHMIIATQRPSVNVITGVIKGNLGTRVALKVASAVDSQVILGEGGAEDLLGNGDLLVDSQKIPGHGFTRLQCPFVDNKEIRRVVTFLRENYTVKYDPNFLDLKDHSAAGPSFLGGSTGGSQQREKDERYEEVKEYVMTLDEVSISEIQRKMYLGFPKAARIMDQLEAAGVVTKNNGSGKRKVLIHSHEALAAKEGEDNNDN